jgi:hypothetical protein
MRPHAELRNLVRTALTSLALTGLLAGCGGGSGGGVVTGPPTPPASGGTSAPTTSTVRVGSLTASIADVDGRALADVSVCVNGPGDGRCVKTDASGTAAFSGLPAGDWSVGTYHPDFLTEYARVTVRDGGTHAFRAALTPGDRYVLVTLASRGRLAADGKSVDAELDVALLGRDGRGLATLAPMDFEFGGVDCGFWYCGAGLGGGMAPVTGSFAGRALAASARRPYDAVLLVDTGGRTNSRWPQPGTLRADLDRLLGSPPVGGTIVVAAPRADAQGCAVRRVAATDGSAPSKLPDGALEGCERTFTDLLTDAIAIAAALPRRDVPARRAVVVLTPVAEDSGAALERAAAAGVELWVVTGFGGEGLALLGRGAYASFYESGAQMKPLLAGLDGLLAGSVSGYRLNVTYSAGGAPMRPDDRIYPYLDVKLPTGSRLSLQSFAVPTTR